MNATSKYVVIKRYNQCRLVAHSPTTHSHVELNDESMNLNVNL